MAYQVYNWFLPTPQIPNAYYVQAPPFPTNVELLDKSLSYIQ
jgi:hypothetical protein